MLSRCRSRVLVATCVAALLGIGLSACAEDDSILYPPQPGSPAPAPDPGTPDQPGDEPDQPDQPDDPGDTPLSLLPACTGSAQSYDTSDLTEVELVEFSGPNISLILGDSGEVAVLFPSAPEFGTGEFPVLTTSVWTAELCINWTGVCESYLVPADGTFVIDELKVSTDSYIVAGAMNEVVFVDDPDDPSCAVTVNTGFTFPFSSPAAN